MRFRRVLFKATARLRIAWHRLTDCKLTAGENDRRVARLQGAQTGRRVVVIGNGPSLKVADLARLTREVTFAHNKIFLAFEETDWRPTYYNVEDPLVIEQNFERINGLQGFPKLMTREEKGLLKADDWSVFYDLVVLKDRDFPRFSDNPFHGVYCGYSVCISSMQWAAYMGAKEIYLIGVDFSFVVPNSDAQGSIRSEGEVNHFHKDYRKPGEKWMIPKLEQQLKAFEYARDWLGGRGVKVFNATRGGKLEVFPGSTSTKRFLVEAAGESAR